MKQWCMDCKAIVETVFLVDEETGARRYICVQCGGEDTEEADHCSICGELISPYKTHIACEECEEYVVREFNTFLTDIEANVSTNMSRSELIDVILDIAM